MSDGNGQALHSVNFNLTTNTVAIAHFLDEDQDADADEVADWIEIKNFGDLDSQALDDADGDGISLRDELVLGLAPNIEDNVTQGGISIRRSPKVAVNFGGAKKLVLKSDPLGLVQSETRYIENNASYQTNSLNGSLNGYIFSHWEINGVRISDTKGVGASLASTTMTENKEIVAKYFHEDLDHDNDEIPDWYEWHYLGSLDQNKSSDSDGDGYSLAEERNLGLSSVIEDNVTEGSISIRRSAKVIVNLGGASKLTVKSDPPGLLVSSLSYPELNSSYSSPSLNGLYNGYYFSHWEINGVRQADDLGVGLTSVTKVLDSDKRFIAKFYPEDQDTDNDRVPDWYEWREFGNLDLNETSDPDQDGFSIAEERKFGLSSSIVDTIEEGSVSMRRSRTTGYVRDPNDPTDSDGDGLTDSQEITLGTDTKKSDTDGDGYSDSEEVNDGTNPLLVSSFRNLAPTQIFGESPLLVAENEPVGTLVGKIKGDDPNDPAFTGNYLFELVDGNGSDDNLKFTLDNNGSLLTGEIFDFEALAVNQDANLSIRIRITDSGHLTFEDKLLVQVINVVEDFDQDGTEDHLDPDDDNDGFSDLLESSKGTDPFDPNSFPNEAPQVHDLSISGFPENLPVPSDIGEFNATDPDANSSITFSLIDGNGSDHNSLFYLTPDGSLSTAVAFDYETNASHYTIRIEVRDEWNATSEKSFLLDLTNVIEDFDQDGIENHLDLDDDNDGFSDLFESEMGTDPLDASSAPNQAPQLHALSISGFPENLPAGSAIGEFNATDPDPDSSLAFSLIDGNGSDHNSLFSLTADGILSNAVTFDYETNASQYTIRVEVRDEWNATSENSLLLELIDLDENPPVISLLGPEEITITTGFSFDDPGAHWTDDHDGNGTVLGLSEDFHASQAGTYEFQYFYIDQAGNDSDLIFRTVVVKDPTLPLIRTLPAEMDGNNTILGLVELVSDGGLAIIETGLEIGQRPSLSDASFHSFASADQAEPISGLPSGVDLYYRAYAINALGISYGATRKVRLPQLIDPNVWWTHALVHDGGWRTLDWFGTFSITGEDNWVYHSQLGWLYVVSDNQKRTLAMEARIGLALDLLHIIPLLLDAFLHRLDLSPAFGKGSPNFLELRDQSGHSPPLNPGSLGLRQSDYQFEKIGHNK